MKTSITFEMGLTNQVTFSNHAQQIPLTALTFCFSFYAHNNSLPYKKQFLNARASTHLVSSIHSLKISRLSIKCPLVTCTQIQHELQGISVMNKNN